MGFGTLPTLRPHVIMRLCRPALGNPHHRGAPYARGALPTSSWGFVCPRSVARVIVGLPTLAFGCIRRRRAPYARVRSLWSTRWAAPVVLGLPMLAFGSLRSRSTAYARVWAARLVVGHHMPALACPLPALGSCGWPGRCGMCHAGGGLVALQ